MHPTNDPQLKAFLPVPPDSPFPIQNLPYGVFCRADGVPSIGVAIGDHVLDLGVLEEAGVFDAPHLKDQYIFTEANLNPFMELGKEAWLEARTVISRLLRQDVPDLRDNDKLREKALVHNSQVEMLLPADIGDYTDFYSSKEHATNVGSMFRGPDKALMPNWVHIPIAYHGRASSIVLSGTDIIRPCGQTSATDNGPPTFGPSKSLDFELELGFFVGPGNELGHPVPVGEAMDHIFGVVLVNDWSARDIQRWEYVPLGPFLGKNFGTSISPWIVPLLALEPFRVPGPVQDPTPLPYLQQSGPQAYDIHLEVWLQSAQQSQPHRICTTNAKYLYWSMAQQLAHHTVNGCNLMPGDLLASGTISGSTPDSYGSLLELAWKGTKPLQLPDGTQRSFLQDGDRLTITGWCQGQGYRIGLGEVTGRILPAKC
jgi:fumarylacetoacetase